MYQFGGIVIRPIGITRVEIQRAIEYGIQFNKICVSEGYKSVDGEVSPSLWA